MKYNICWDCGNACANKCDYIRLGTEIKGWTAQKRDDYYLIDQCPNFVSDGDIGAKSIAKILGISITTLNNILARGQYEKLDKKAREKGYTYSCYKCNDSKPIHLLLPLNVERGLDVVDDYTKEQMWIRRQTTVPFSIKNTFKEES